MQRAAHPYPKSHYLLRMTVDSICRFNLWIGELWGLGIVGPGEMFEHEYPQSMYLSGLGRLSGNFRRLSFASWIHSGKFDMVQQCGDKGKQQERQGEYQGQAHCGQSVHRPAAAHKGDRGGQRQENHDQPSHNLAINIPKGQGATESVALKLIHDKSPKVAI